MKTQHTSFGGPMSDDRPYNTPPHEDGAIEHWDFDDDRLDGSRQWNIDENGNIWPFTRDESRSMPIPGRQCGTF